MAPPRVVLVLGVWAAVIMRGAAAHGARVGPRTMRFLRQEAAAGEKAQAETEESMKIGPCGCDFLSGVTATKPVGSTANCAPISALCSYADQQRNATSNGRILREKDNNARQNQLARQFNNFPSLAAPVHALV